MASEWISVKTPPPFGVPVWVSMGGIVQFISYCRDGGGDWYPMVGDSDFAPDGTFDYWMPLPEPPKETSR